MSLAVLFNGYSNNYGANIDDVYGYTPFSSIDVNEINKLFSVGNTINNFKCDNIIGPIQGLRNVKNIVIVNSYSIDLIDCEGVETINISSKGFNSQISILQLPIAQSLIKLDIFSDVYNQPINLSNTKIKELIIDSCVFNQPINNLPDTLEKLYLSVKKYDHKFENFPYGMKEFRFKFSEYYHNFDNLPLNLVSLFIHNINTNKDKLFAISDNDYKNNKFNILDINDNFEILEYVNYYHLLFNLPVSLKSLTLINYFTNYEKLPNNIEILDIGFDVDIELTYNKIIYNLLSNIKILPKMLKKLYFQRNLYNLRRKNVLVAKKLNILDYITRNIDCSNIIINDGTYPVINT